MGNKFQVSELISIVVKNNYQDKFEEWHKDVIKILNEQRGFIGCELIRPSDITALEYFIIVKFATLEDLARWKESKEFLKVKDESKKFVINLEASEKQYGTEMLFSRPLNNIYYPKPAFWKQAVISIITVYPLVLLSIMVISPFTKNLPLSLALFISICVVSPIMVFIMPKISKLFEKWLYP